MDAYYLECLRSYLNGRKLPAGGLDEAGLLKLAHSNGLDVHTFKRSLVMPRVRAALSAVKSIGAQSLLDIGSGRGAFLWPLLDEMPWLHIVSVERSADRRALLGAVADGGAFDFRAELGDATALQQADRSFDVVTILEVLEHLERPELAAVEAFRAAARGVIATVPSRPDDNPEHIQLFTPERLDALFRAAGASRVKVSEVEGSFLCLALR